MSNSKNHTKPDQMSEIMAYTEAKGLTFEDNLIINYLMEHPNSEFLPDQFKDAAADSYARGWIYLDQGIWKPSKQTNELLETVIFLMNRNGEYNA